MIKRILIMLVVASFLALFAAHLMRMDNRATEGGIGYLDREPETLGGLNVVTSIVVTYRGLDTLGEVSVLFLAATVIALLSGMGKSARPPGRSRPASEILETGATYLSPVIMMFGIYIFLNGHLTPGGGFQGGAVIASSVVLSMLAFPRFRLGEGILDAVESLSGFFYVAAGVAGLVLASGFLDSRVLPAGHAGRIISAGTIPLIYSFIGLKVGTELSKILEEMGRRG